MTWMLPSKVKVDLKVNWHNTIHQLAQMSRCPIKCKMPSNLKLELAKSKTTWWGWFHLQAWTQPSKLRITHLKNWHQKLNFRTFTTLQTALPTRSSTSGATKTSILSTRQVQWQALIQEMWTRNTPETRWNSIRFRIQEMEEAWKATTKRWAPSRKETLPWVSLNCSSLGFQATTICSRNLSKTRMPMVKTIRQNWCRTHGQTLIHQWNRRNLKSNPA